MSLNIFSFTGVNAMKTNADFSYTFFNLNPLTGQPIDMTDWEAKMTIAYYPEVRHCACPPSPPELITIYTLTSSGDTPAITFDVSTGAINLLVPESVTLTLTVNTNAIYDLLLMPPGGAIQEFAQGPFAILSGVTDPA
jgi:hypothetical protein